ncbi:hypothetical protein KUCAC02_017853 [Chaenocephalus aceratus]|nr:hypothetical protein KUCAC02_017853 [Chaenocephalus aceratus]
MFIYLLIIVIIWKTPSVVGPLVGATTRPPIPPGQLRVEEEPEVPGLEVPHQLQVEVPGLEVPLQVEVPGLDPNLEVNLGVEVPGLDPNLEVNLGVEVPGLDPNLEVNLGVESLAVPYSMALPSGVYNKMLITIAGTIKSNADQFGVNLKTPTDLAFHFNPRFNEYGKKVIVRNSFINKTWGKEERDLQNFPFQQGKPFEMKIMCTNKEFKVAVNNSHVLTYHHRVSDLRSINELNIDCDITLSKVNVETMP